MFDIAILFKYLIIRTMRKIKTDFMLQASTIHPVPGSFGVHDLT